ncbi:hypothetical protein GW17_00010642 [Ensete ventricosum]|uniref:Uncharacterized protein n=1 Tax=Ensete ventricosum TaxID=4639 RepID=A0A426Z698_ENSVE|nr:hypothetical protein B296_00031987 [Ensete ventricosum]RWW25033.1 hypothetical protein GW17_00010642 [Ensete ventricosum]
MCFYFFGPQEHLVKTRFGEVSVTVFGDKEKPALITYPDVALNYVSCFQGLFSCPEAASLFLHSFCIYHISPPGHEVGTFDRSFLFVGENSPFHVDALHMASKLDRRYSALVEVHSCGSLVTEEQPHAMLIPMEYFFMGYGLYRPSQLTGSPCSPLSPYCISPELLSPESMGVKLKPIKTRASQEV